MKLEIQFFVRQRKYQNFHIVVRLEFNFSLILINKLFKLFVFITCLYLTQTITQFLYKCCIFYFLTINDKHVGIHEQFGIEQQKLELKNLFFIKHILLKYLFVNYFQSLPCKMSST